MWPKPPGSAQRSSEEIKAKGQSHLCSLGGALLLKSPVHTVGFPTALILSHNINQRSWMGEDGWLWGGDNILAEEKGWRQATPAHADVINHSVSSAPPLPSGVGVLPPFLFHCCPLASILAMQTSFSTQTKLRKELFTAEKNNFYIVLKLTKI